MPLKHLDLTILDPDRQQPRAAMTDTELTQLVESIRARGLLLPLRVRGPDPAGRYAIVSGHRRYAALRRLAATTAPCLVIETPTDEATVLAEQLAENVIRQNLTPVEEADAYRRYLRLTGVTAAAAAEQLQVSAARISRALALLELPEEVRAAVHTGAVPADTAYHLSRLPAGETRDQLLTKAAAGNLSRDAAARAVRAARTEPTSASLTRASFRLAADRTLTLSGPAVELGALIDTLEDVLKEARRARTHGFDITTLAKMFRDRAANGGIA